MCFSTHQKTRLSQPNRKPMKNQFKIHTHKPTATTTNPWNKHDPKGNSHNPFHQRATANQTHHHKPTATQHKPTANHNGARPTVRRAPRQSESHNEARPMGPGKNSDASRSRPTGVGKNSDASWSRPTGPDLRDSLGEKREPKLVFVKYVWLTFLCWDILTIIGRYIILGLAQGHCLWPTGRIH